MLSAKEWLERSWQRLRAALGAASQPSKRVAVLIDGDSFAPRLAGELFNYAASLGSVISAQLFANFAAVRSTAWSPALTTHGIIAMQHFNRNNGKNGTDIALVIAALDLLHRGSIDVFVVVAADSDFTALAHRIRHSGATVHGVGPASSSAAFKQSCTVFVVLEELGGSASRAADGSDAPPARWSQEPLDAENQVLTALIALGGARDWVDVTALGAELARGPPRFDTRVYRRRHLTDLLAALDSVTLDRQVMPPPASQWWRGMAALSLKQRSPRDYAQTASGSIGCWPDPGRLTSSQAIWPTLRI